MHRDDEKQYNEPLPNRPRANYFDHQHLADPFSDPFLLDAQDKAPEDVQARKEIEAFLPPAKADSFPEEMGKAGEDCLGSFASVSCKCFFRIGQS